MPRRKIGMLAFAAGSLALLTCAQSSKADTQPQLRFQNGHFEPANLDVAANQPFKVMVVNQDSDAIEFESFELHRERVVRPGETITVFIPALPAGSYEFFDDFHHQAPKGMIVSK